MLRWAISYTFVLHKLILQDKLLEGRGKRALTSHSATFIEFVAALQDALYKVQLTSPYRKECGNKK